MPDRLFLMKKWATTAALLAFSALATTTPSTTLGRETWATQVINGEPLYGKVKEVTECTTDRPTCKTLKFNASGVEMSSLNNRKLLSSAGGTVKYSSTLKNGAVYLDTFKNGRISQVEYYPQKGFLERKMQYVHDSKGQLTRYDLQEFNRSGKQIRTVSMQFTYQSGRLVRSVVLTPGFEVFASHTREGRKLYAFDNARLLNVFDYKLDKQGNWTHMYEFGDLKAERRITYYP